MYFTNNQIIIGKFSRSLYVGNKMEYLFAIAIFLVLIETAKTELIFVEKQS